MKQVLVGCLVVFVLVILVAGGLFWYVFLHDLPTFTGAISAPSQVTAGDTFSFAVIASNPHPDAIELDSIDVADSFLAGFQVVLVEPKPLRTFQIPLTNQRSYGFDQRVEANGSATVTFTLRAVQKGHFSGDVDLCNPHQDFHTLVADVVVTGAD